MLTITSESVVRTRFIHDPKGKNHRVAVEVIGTDQSEIVPLTRKPKYFDNFHASALFDVFGEDYDVISRRTHGSTSGQPDYYWTIVPADDTLLFLTDY